MTLTEVAAILVVCYTILKNMAIDWTKNYKRYKGLWVALQDDESTVVGSGRSIQTALQKARQKGFKNPIVMRVPTKIAPYVGNTCV